MSTVAAALLGRISLFDGEAGSPYRGLVPFAEDDEPFFFGRERETDILVGNILGSRLLVTYGPSGVGKSSLLRAGAAATLRRIALQNQVDCGTPELVVAVVDAWRDDPAAEVGRRVQGAVNSLLREDEAAAFQAALAAQPCGLRDLLRTACRSVGGDVLLILDQFEEYLLYHTGENGEDAFAAELVAIVNDAALPVNVLISIREDALARLDRFKGRIPGLFSNCVRIDYLRSSAARRAVVRPLNVYNRLYHPEGGGVRIERSLVKAVLRETESHQIEMGEEGRGGIVADSPTPRVVTPYLQLVMTRLWEAEKSGTPQVLRLSTFESLGGARDIVRTHLDEVLTGLDPRECEVASEVFRYLVTPAGTKFACSVDDLVGQTELPRGELEKILKKLASGEMRVLLEIGARRTAWGNQPERFQIYHDVLAAAVLDWRRRFLATRRHEQLLAEEQEQHERELARVETRRRKDRRRFRWIVAVGGLLAVVVAGLWVAYIRWDDARSRKAFIAAELRSTDMSLRAKGFVPIGDWLGRLGNGASDRLPLPLPLANEGEFVVAGRCDDYCRRLGLILESGRSRTVLAADTGLLPEPQLHIAAGGTKLQLAVAMKQCEAKPCYYGLRLYHRTPEARVRWTLQQQDSALAEEAYAPVGEFTRGSGGPLESKSFDLEVKPGVDYAVAAVCDYGCRDMDMVIFDGNEPVASDLRPDSIALIRGLVPDQSHRYRVQVNLSMCAAPRCSYAYRVYSAPIAARQLALMRLRLDGEVTEYLTAGGHRQPIMPTRTHGFAGGGRWQSTVDVAKPGRYVLYSLCASVADECEQTTEVALGGRVIAHDSAGGWLTFTAPEPGRYQLTMQMERCGRPPCSGGYRIFTDPAI
jgi:hypothetical protein